MTIHVQNLRNSPIEVFYSTIRGKFGPYKMGGTQNYMFKTKSIAQFIIYSYSMHQLKGDKTYGLGNGLFIANYFIYI